MELSINLSYFLKPHNGGGRPGFVVTDPIHPLEECIKAVSELGYKKIDYNGYGADDIDEARALIDKYGLTVNQSHAPAGFTDMKEYDSFSKKLLTAIENCHKLGSKIFVVHGNMADKSKPYVPSEVLEFNYRLYSPVVEYAATCGMKVAFENVMSFENNPFYGSTPEELFVLTDKFSDSGAVGICWDTGHGNVMFDPNSIEELAKVGDRLISTHIHDNYFGSDMHGIPFTGNLDWNKLMKTLKSMNYKGDFTFEFVYKNYPEELFPDMMKFAYKAGNYLLSL